MASALSHIVYTQYDLVRKPSTLDALIGYFTPFYVIHQRLSLQFLSSPEDGCKKRPKHVEYYCSYYKHTAKFHHVGSFYILNTELFMWLLFLQDYFDGISCTDIHTFLKSNVKLISKSDLHASMNGHIR